MLHKKIYLDNSATTSLYPEVLNEMKKYFCDIYGNPSSLHYFGRYARISIENSRTKIASLLNASPEEIFFTSCGTESNNISIFGILNYNKSLKLEKKHIITSKIEHHSVLYPCKHLEKIGHSVTYLNVNEKALVSVEDIKKSIKKNTVLISIMHANNEVGSLQEIEKISLELKKINKTRDQKIYFHTDSVQTAGKIKLDVKNLGIDLLSMSAHKFNGPKGIGVLYIKSGTNISSITFGGNHEKGIRPGTENVAFIVGIAKSFEISNFNIVKKSKHILFLREKLKNGILKNIPHVSINGDSDKTVPNILNVSFKYIDGEALLLMLDINGIAVSTGSACASFGAISHVLSAISNDDYVIRGSIRFSIGYNNTENEIDYVVDILPKIVYNLRNISPIHLKNCISIKK
jgi:cysteine desulfurase